MLNSRRKILKIFNTKPGDSFVKLPALISVFRIRANSLQMNLPVLRCGVDLNLRSVGLVDES